MRALVGDAGDDATRGAALLAIMTRLKRIGGGEAVEAHVVMEGLRGFIAHPVTDRLVDMLRAVVDEAAAASKMPPLTRGWIECLAVAAQQRAAATPDYTKLASCGHGGLPDHLRLPLVGELIGAGVGSLADRRTALRTLLAHADARVRLAGMTALDPMWKDGESAIIAPRSPPDRRAGSPDPIIAGGAAMSPARCTTASPTGVTTSMPRS